MSKDKEESYKLSEEELEKYRNLPKPTDSLGQPVKRSIVFHKGGYRK